MRESARLARRLDAAFRKILASLRTPTAALARRPAPGSWSPIEVAEHVTLMNHHVLILLEKIAARCEARLARGERPPEAPASVDRLEELAERGFRWESPEHMIPGGHATVREIAISLREQRRRCLRLLARMPDGEGSLHSISMSVVGGKLDLYGYLTLVALHLERHAAQMDRALGLD